MVAAMLRFQAIDDPQQLACENDYLSRVLRVCRDVAMTPRIFVKAYRPGEEIRHCFLFGYRQLRIGVLSVLSVQRAVRYSPILAVLIPKVHTTTACIPLRGLRMWSGWRKCAIRL
jgi:hypothetical protein